MRRGRESLPILSISDHAPSARDKERTRLQQIAAEGSAELVTTRDSHNPIRDVHARANVTPRRFDSHRRLRHTVDLHLPEGQGLRAREEATDNSVADTVHLTPPHQRRGPLEHDHPRVKRPPVIARDVQRRTRTITQPHTEPLKP